MTAGVSPAAPAVGLAALAPVGCAVASLADRPRAERVARAHMRGAIGRAAVDRARVEVRPSRVGWVVVFRDAEASCGDGSFWPGACRFGPTVYRDVYTCVERDGHRVPQVGGDPRGLADDDPCQPPGGTPAPPVAATPLGGPAGSP